ncbi:hypothetical protein RUM43_010802 [Polyplax serrata]|uniref:Uncharacterized protein n=1 Tax=Polyplax serrata TaxID=468196 RepID=A0AAN8P5A4_POLSC
MIRNTNELSERNLFAENIRVIRKGRKTHERKERKLKKKKLKACEIGIDPAVPRTRAFERTESREREAEVEVREKQKNPRKIPEHKMDIKNERARGQLVKSLTTSRMRHAMALAFSRIFSLFPN